MIVFEVDLRPRNAFSFIKDLLGLDSILRKDLSRSSKESNLKHIFVKLLVKLLVGVVDAELLEGVELEDLEAVNVEDADEVRLAVLRVALERIVDALHEPIEELRIQGLNEMD